MKPFSILFIAFLLIVSAESKAQQDSTIKEVFTAVEQMPEFPGGQNAMMKFIVENTKYPSKAKKTNVQGKVFVSFVVGKEGQLANVRVIRGIDPLLDEEAVRVIKKMPKWTPGRQNGKPVNVQFTIPLNFKLSEEKESK